MTLSLARWRAELASEMDDAESRRAFDALEAMGEAPHPFTPYRVDSEVCKTCEGKRSDHAPKSAEAPAQERCAELVTDFDAPDFDAPQVHRVSCGHALPCPLHTPPKSAEASMKERIEGLERVMRRAVVALRKRRTDFDHEGNYSTEEHMLCDVLVAMVRELDGPSDPDRDRETTAEVLKP